MARKRIPPFDLRIDRLTDGGVGVGEFEGRSVHVRGAPPGAVVHVRPAGRRKGILRAYRVAMVEPAANAVEPQCSLFGLCGGCTLQEMPLAAQRAAKEAVVHEQVGDLDGVQIHPVAGTDQAYGYRNKVELSFGTRRYLSDEEMVARAPMTGRFVGFHAAGRFDRIVEPAPCALVSAELGQIVTTVRAFLQDSAFEPWDVRAHTGFWRHLVLRETHFGERLVAFYTAEPPEGAAGEMEEIAARLEGVQGVLWFVNPRTGDAAIGDLRALLRGRDWVEERLGKRSYALSATAFFQTNTAAAEVLYDIIRKAAGGGKRLLDLYCGVGSIGLHLADDFEEIVGVELNEEAVKDARKNAERNKVGNTRYIAGPVREVVGSLEADVIVVDPPRAGLHPKVAECLAVADCERLVYVACKAASLGRDREILETGGWRLTDLWTVDLFPQTGHIEAVGLFVRG
jgi:23S rRNA (uracil1939-C5)-methyltransferase